LKYYWGCESREGDRVGTVAHMGEMTKAYRILEGNSKRRCHMEHLSVNGKIILPCV
jgi:hypothetical protein